MTREQLAEKNAVVALKYGLITWFQFFEIIRGLK